MASTISKPDTFKCKRGFFERLNSDNHLQWSGSMIRVLKAESLWKIVTGEETCPKNTNETSGTISEPIKAYRKRQNEAGALLYNACSVSARIHIGKLEDPKIIWETLKTRLDPAASMPVDKH
jgi:hypothetical protein